MARLANLAAWTYFFCMTRRGLLFTVLLCAGVAAGCGSTESPPAVVEELRPAETFDWSGQPIAFALPPLGWERQRSQPGGREGVRFIKAGSVGEEVRVQERLSVADRDRCGRLRELLREFEKMDRRTFEKALQRARLYANPPINDEEEWFAEEANLILDEARTAFRANDPVGVRSSIEQVLKLAGRIRYSLDEVVDEVRFSGEGFPPEVRAEVGESSPAELAGEPAMRLDYALHYNKRDYSGRELYVVNNNHLFVVGYQGLAENLPMFERILATVSFPEGECRH